MTDSAAHPVAPACTRRGFLASLGALAAWPRLPRAPRRLLFVWLDGGASHLDTFDCKPEAGAHVRGDLGAVRAPLPGVFVSEHLPLLARRLDRCALIRSLTHGEGNHDRGTHFVLTGKRPSPVMVHPSLGAVLASEVEADAMPAFVAVPDAGPFGGAGFLPSHCAPFEVGGEPERPDWQVRHLAPHEGSARATELLRQVDELAGPARTEAERARDRALGQALAIAKTAAVRDAFDLRAEPADVRERYGRHRLGQSCLLARRLLRKGARAVLVRDAGWDHHVKIARALTYGFPPKLRALDQAIAALLDDLRDDDGDVLVCVASEFGRTPRLNPAGGRDHWPRAHWALLFGAGVRAGVVHGATDAHGEEPIEDPVSPADLFATLVAALQLDANRVLRSPDGRPVRLVEPGGRAIDAVLL